MRPLYELEKDRINEQSCMAAFCDHFGGLRYKKLPDGPRYSVDYGIFRLRDMIGVAEVKVRNQKYDTLILGLSKCKELLEYHRMKLRAVVIVSWPDGLFYYNVSEALLDCSITMAGRTDRGDDQDVEPCFMIPVDQFAKIDLNTV